MKRLKRKKQQTLFEIQERSPRITSQDASKASGMFGAWASVGASLNQSFQANFDALAQASSQFSMEMLVQPVHKLVVVGRVELVVE